MNEALDNLADKMANVTGAISRAMNAGGENRSRWETSIAHLRDIKKNTRFGRMISKTIGQLYQSTIGAAWSLDQMQMDLSLQRIDAAKTVAELTNQSGLLAGSLEQAKFLARLQEVGIEGADTNLLNLATILTKTGRGTSQLVNLADQLVAGGASKKTQQSILDAVAETSLNTKQTTAAVLASLRGLTGLEAELEVLGIGSTLGESIIAFSDAQGFTEAQNRRLSELVGAMVKPENFAQNVAAGVQPFANILLDSNSTQAQMMGALQGAIDTAAGRTEDFIATGANATDNVNLVLQQATGIFGKVGAAALDLRMGAEEFRKEGVHDFRSVASTTKDAVEQTGQTITNLMDAARDVGIGIASEFMADGNVQQFIGELPKIVRSFGGFVQDLSSKVIPEMARTFLIAAGHIHEASRPLTAVLTGAEARAIDQTTRLLEDGTFDASQSVRARKVISQLATMREEKHIANHLQNHLLELIDEVRKTNRNGGDSNELLLEMIRATEQVERNTWINKTKKDWSMGDEAMSYGN